MQYFSGKRFLSLVLVLTLAACGNTEERVLVPLYIDVDDNLVGRVSIHSGRYGGVSMSTNRPDQEIVISMRSGARVPGGDGSELCLTGVVKTVRHSLSVTGDEPLCMHKTPAGWVYLSGLATVIDDKEWTIGEHRTLESCLDALDGTDYLLRRGCIKDFKRISTPGTRREVLLALTTQLNDKEPGLRQTTAETIGLLGCHAAFPALREASKREPDEIARIYMGEAVSLCAGISLLEPSPASPLSTELLLGLYSEGATKWSDEQVLAATNFQRDEIMASINTYLTAPDANLRKAAGQFLFLVTFQHQKNHPIKGDALRYAAYSGQLDTVRELLEKYPDEGEPKIPVSPIYYAAYNGHAEIIDLLVTHGSELGAYNGPEVWSFNVAAKKGYRDVIKSLIANGAYISAGSTRTESNYLVARKHGHQDIAELLILSGARLEDEKTRDTAVFEKLLIEYPTVYSLLGKIEEIMLLRKNRNLFLHGDAYSYNDWYDTRVRKTLATPTQAAPDSWHKGFDYLTRGDAKRSDYPYEWEAAVLLYIAGIREQPGDAVYLNLIDSMLSALFYGKYDELACTLVVNTGNEMAGKMDKRMNAVIAYHMKYCQPAEVPTN